MIGTCKKGIHSDMPVHLYNIHRCILLEGFINKHVYLPLSLQLFIKSKYVI